MRGAKLVFAIVLPLLAAGCGSPVDVEEPPQAPIRTEFLQYELRAAGDGVRTEISYTFANAADDPIYIVNCQGATPVVLEKKVEGEWVTVWGNAVNDCPSPPVVIGSGEDALRTLSVYGGNPGCGCGPQFSVADRSGVYRLVLTDVLWSFDPEARPFGARVPRAFRVSNSFQLTESL